MPFLLGSLNHISSNRTLLNDATRLLSTLSTLSWTVLALVVVLGYSQIPAVDFTEKHSPVVDHETIKLVLEASHFMDLSGKIIAIKTAFLHGDLREDIHMTIPDR